MLTKVDLLNAVEKSISTKKIGRAKLKCCSYLEYERSIEVVCDLLSALGVNYRDSRWDNLIGYVRVNSFIIEFEVKDSDGS